MPAIFFSYSPPPTSVAALSGFSSLTAGVDALRLDAHSQGAASNPLGSGTNRLAAGSHPLASGTNPLHLGSNPLTSYSYPLLIGFDSLVSAYDRDEIGKLTADL